MIALKSLAKPVARAFGLNQYAFILLNHPEKGKSKIAFVRQFSDSEENILKSKRPPVRLPEVPLHTFLFDAWEPWKDKIAIDCAASGKKLTYKEVQSCTRKLGHSLKKVFKLKKGDCQCSVLFNCPEYPAIILAGSLIGIYTSTINPIYTPQEISIQLKVTQPKIIYTMLETYGNCLEALSKLKIHLPIVIIKSDPKSSIPAGAIDFLEIANGTIAEEPDATDIDLDATLVVPFSSGTSGLPKGVELSHRNITANLAQTEDDSFYKEKSKADNGQSLVLGILPMFHIYGMVVVTFSTLFSGDRLIILNKFEPKLFVETIYTKKPGLLYLVPPLIFFLAHQPLVEKKHLQNVYYIMSGAAPYGIRDIEALKAKSPNIQTIQGYGMTETSPVITKTSELSAQKLASVGKLISLTQIKIADVETGKALPNGGKGEIWVKGPQVMKGYLNLPDVTKNTFSSDGWLKTGDVGYYDEDGDVFVSDRIKELIKVKAFQVAPAEIEEVLRSHPKIQDAGVIGVPHPKLGEAPRAFVVLKKNAIMEEGDVIDFVRTHLAPYKQLEGGVVFVKTIPRNATGKILRRVLVEMSKASE